MADKIIIPWNELEEGQKRKATSLPQSDAWWMHWKKGIYCFKISFSSVVKTDFSQIKFKGATIQTSVSNNKSHFVLVLNSDADLVIFKRFCEDLLAVPLKDNAQQYADSLFVRMKQWMRFLQKIKNKELDIRSQLGLMAELKFVELLHDQKHFSYKEVLAGWKGPEKSSKDFIFSDFNAEIKSYFEDENTIKISNENQLTYDGVPFYLVCYKFRQDTEGENLAEIVENIKASAVNENEDNCVVFEQKLLNAGYNPVVDYKNLISVKDLSCYFYNVSEEFPCIKISDLHPGISNVKYDLDLGSISNFIQPSPFKGD